MGSVCPSRRGPWTQGPPVVGRTWYGLACARCCWAEQRVVMFHVVGDSPLEILLPPPPLFLLGVFFIILLPGRCCNSGNDSDIKMC